MGTNKLDWHLIADMPVELKDGRDVWLRAGRKEFLATMQLGFMDDDDNDTAAWCEKIEGYAPSNWTDGVCWSSNEYGHPSSQPTHYMETTEDG